MSNDESAPIRLNEQVEQAFDKAAARTKHDPTLLAQIKACNTVCRFDGVLTPDSGHESSFPCPRRRKLIRATKRARVGAIRRR
jgi:hypothetical protein